MIMPKMTIFKFSLTKGRLPKKKPAPTNNPTHKIAPETL